jgi:predicted deacetylase
MGARVASARFVVGFDDICPTMNWHVWRQVEALLDEHGITPLLAVVPDNQDPKLMVAPAAGDFWQRLRQRRDRGWTIGLHGYQHRYVTARAGLLHANPQSEFAGLPRSEQRHKLERACALLRREGLEPSVWVAPSHSFDETTVDLLPQVGIRAISDGYAFYPFLGRNGLVWVPRQMGRLRPVPFGVWTVRYHINDWGAGDLAAFARDLGRYAPAIVSFDAVLAEYSNRRPSLADRMLHKVLVARGQARTAWRRAIKGAAHQGARRTQEER